MIKVTLGNTLSRQQVIVSEDTTLRQVLEENNFDYAGRVMTLDGSILGPGQLNNTFKDFGIQESCYLLSVVKADNA